MSPGKTSDNRHLLSALSNTRHGDCSTLFLGLFCRFVIMLRLFGRRRASIAVVAEYRSHSAFSPRKRREAGGLD